MYLLKQVDLFRKMLLIQLVYLDCPIQSVLYPNDFLLKRIVNMEGKRI